MAVKIDSHKIAAEVEKELGQYSAEIAENVKSIATDIANGLLKNIKRDSPDAQTGKYKKGWTVSKEFEDESNIRFRIYNKAKWRLTHLLEFGHQIFTGIATIEHGKSKGAVMNFTKGGRVEGIPHIKPNEEASIKEYVEKVKEAIRKCNSQI